MLCALFRYCVLQNGTSMMYQTASLLVCRTEKNQPELEIQTAVFIVSKHFDVFYLNFYLSLVKAIALVFKAGAFR